MGKIIVILMIISLFFLIGYGGYKLFPYLQTQINNPDLFPQLRQLLKNSPVPAGISTPSASPSLFLPTPLPFSTSDLDLITDFLKSHIAIESFSGSVFCAFDILSADPVNTHMVYLWALCQEYYLSEGSVATGSGISIPVALATSMQAGNLTIDSYREPRAGTYYSADISDIFPRDLIISKISHPDPVMLNHLEEEVKTLSQNYFKI